MDLAKDIQKNYKLPYPPRMIGEMIAVDTVDTGVTVTCTDRIVTLSTCTPEGGSRFLVMGKLAEIEE